MARVLFVCLHNAGRSQMSEALFTRSAAGNHEARSAGTTPGEQHLEPGEKTRAVEIQSFLLRLGGDHVALLIEPHGLRRAYWVMTQLPQYIQLTALLLGAAAHTRRVRLLGRYRSWRLV